MRRCFLLLSVLLVPPVAWAQGPSGEPPRETLPSGALFRLGSDRLRLLTSCRQLVFLDEKHLLSSDDEGRLDLWHGVRGDLLPVSGPLTKIARNVVLSASGTKLALGFFPLRVVDWPDPMGEATFKTVGVDLAISGDGKKLAVRDSSRKVAIFDTQKEDPIREWELGAGVEFRDRAMALSPDGEELALGDNAGVISIWNARSGEKKHQWKAPVSEVWRIEYAPDGATLVTGHGDGAARIWHPGSGRLLHTLSTSKVRSLAHLSFSRDGKRILTCALGLPAKVWDATTGREIAALGPKKERANVWAAAISPEGKTVAIAIDRSISLWNIETGTSVSAAADLDAFAFLTTTRDRILAIGSRETAAWDGDRLLRQETKVASVAALTPDRTRRPLALAVTDSAAEVRELLSGKLVLSLKREAGDAFPAAAFSPDGRLLALQRDGFSVDLLEVPSGKRRGVFVSEFGLPRTPRISGDGEWLVLPGAGGIETYHVPSGKRSHRLGMSFTSVHVSPDSRLLFVLSGFTWQVFDLATGQLVHRDKGEIRGLAFLEAPRLVALAGEAAIDIVDMATWKPIASFAHRPRNFARDLAASTRCLASLHRDGTLIIWDLAVAEKALPPLFRPAAEQMDGLCRALGDDGALAHGAFWSLAGDPKNAVAVLRKSLARIEPLDDKAIQDLVDRLDRGTTKERLEIEDRLSKLADLPHGVVHRNLERELPLTLKRRLERVLSNGERAALQGRRAIQLLELLASEEARRFLAELAGGAERSALTTQARGALDRLARAAE